MSRTKRKGPLAGVKVIEIAAVGPVPFAGMMLSDLGAEVIRIDRMGESGLGIPMDQSVDFMARGRRSVILDLKNTSGTELALKLIESADVLIEGMRPGAMERLGLGPDVCLARNPRLIYGRMTGWGQTGPLAHKAGHDINYISMNGILDSVGLDGGPPVPPINLVGDYGGGAMFLMVGVLAALNEAGGNGKGRVIDAAMIDGSSYLMTAIHMFVGAGMWQPDRGTNLLDSGAPFYGVYETSDGKHMAVGAIEPKFYWELLDGLGLSSDDTPAPLDRSKWPELKAIFSAVFAGKTRDEWTDIFNTRDACVTPVLSLQESIEHEHNAHRNNFVTVDGRVRPNLAPRFDDLNLDVDAAVTFAGEDTRQILQELKLSDDEIDTLIARSVAGVPD